MVARSTRIACHPMPIVGFTNVSDPATLGMFPCVTATAPRTSKRSDALSGFGAFGNEYHGLMPARRWIITRVDLLALEQVGYKLRPSSFAPWEDATPDCSP